MNVVIDIEANGLENPDKIWLIVCKDIDTGNLHIFRNVSNNHLEKERFLEFSKSVELWIGHHILGYDYPVLDRLLNLVDHCPLGKCLDTLIISKMVDYSRKEGHSVEDYGTEFGIEKGQFYKFTDPELNNNNSILFGQLEKYCIRDVDITERIYKKYLKFILNPDYKKAIELEHKFQLIVNALHDNGFSFNKVKAEKLLEKVTGELAVLDKNLLDVFPPRSRCVREYTPKCTKHGTISKTSVPRSDSDLSVYTVGASFCTFVWDVFNPSSHKQLVDVLIAAGWKPIDKTQTHIDTERELNRLKYHGNRSTEVDLRIKECHNKLQSLSKTGWKINEQNLSTLPANAPQPARLLAKRILLESRRRTLTEWLGLVQADGRVHGRFYGLGAWTHRMSHQKPNTANIPNEFDNNGKKKLLGKELRSLWQAPKNRLLVGVDAEGIQLRIFAHYVNDPNLIKALVEGDKSKKTDPHSYNKGVLGDACKARQAAKRFLYALFLGAGIDKLGLILECSRADAEKALARLLEAYPGFAKLKREVIPEDARRGWFLGLDGRPVVIPDPTLGGRKHLAMSGYLQNGEAVVMKAATLKWFDKLKEYDSSLVNFVHDEWQTETPNNMEIALKIAKLQADSLREVGEELNLRCPLAGSYWNDDHKDFTIATNWAYTH